MLERKQVGGTEEGGREGERGKDKSKNGAQGSMRTDRDDQSHHLSKGTSFRQRIMVCSKSLFVGSVKSDSVCMFSVRFALHWRSPSAKPWRYMCAGLPAGCLIYPPDTINIQSHRSCTAIMDHRAAVTRAKCFLCSSVYGNYDTALLPLTPVVRLDWCVRCSAALQFTGSMFTWYVGNNSSSLHQQPKNKTQGNRVKQSQVWGAKRPLIFLTQREKGHSSSLIMVGEL